MFSLSFFHAGEGNGSELCRFGVFFEGSLLSCAAIMAAWGHPGMPALPAEITEEKLQEKGKLGCQIKY